MPLFPRRLKYVTGRTWKADSSFIYPELNNLERGNVLDRPNIGVCFSGGGTRSATCTHGQLRALRHLGLIDKIRYISCVSGGSWASVPYTFLSKHYPDSHFLGAVKARSDIDIKLLTNIPRHSFLKTVVDAGLTAKYLSGLYSSEAFSKAVAEIFLKPFELHSQSKFFTYTKAQVAEILRNNKDAESSDFYRVHDNRPFLIVGGTLLRRDDARDYLFEMTPWYSGINVCYKEAGSRKQNIGGGYVESLAINSDAPDSITDKVTVRVGSRRHRFTLSDVVGISGAAPAEYLQNLRLTRLGFPELDYWPVQPNPEKTLKSKSYDFGDGGNLENLGIIPLIKRGVDRIIVFANTKRELSESGMNGAIEDLFQPGHVNCIFQKTARKELFEKLHEQKKNAEAIFYEQSLSTVDNEHHEISRGKALSVLWVYNEKFVKWLSQLPPETQELLKTSDWESFPHYRTFEENPPAIIQLKNIQANLLSYHSSAVILENASVFQQFCQ